MILRTKTLNKNQTQHTHKHTHTLVATNTEMTATGLTLKTNKFMHVGYFNAVVFKKKNKMIQSAHIWSQSNQLVLIQKTGTHTLCFGSYTTKLWV